MNDGLSMYPCAGAVSLGPGLLLITLFYQGLLVQNCTQQRIVNLDVSIVIDEAKLAKLVHEMADAGSGSADHLRQCFLTNIRTDQLRAACLPEIRE